MTDKYFLDTNIIVYSFDSDSDKSIRSQELIKQGLTDQSGVISYQVIQEFVNVSTRKFKTSLTHNDCSLYCQRVLFPLCQVYPSEDFYIDALDVSERWKYSFYDSLIISAASLANCNILYSEDLQHNQKIRNLTIINPYKQ